MGGPSSADTAAEIQILAHEILYEIGVPGSAAVASRIAVRLEVSPMQSDPFQWLVRNGLTTLAINER